MSKPLAGIKVIEIGQELAGPFAGLFLADMGAEVVKVENKTTGDTSRWLLPITIAGPDVRNAMVPPMFVGANRGKRSIATDLKNPKAIELVCRIAKSYDVLMTNYRPGVLDRLGLGWDEMRNINPRLVYAQASSWGPVGPWATRASRDPLAQAAGGLMAKTGMPSDPPADRRHSRRRQLWSTLLRRRNPGRAGRARAHRRGPARRHLDLWDHDRYPGHRD